MSVRVERNGPVTTVIMNRPEARNAVNGPTAAELFAAFDDFDNDDSASVAVLCGRQRDLLRRCRSQGVRHTGRQPRAPDRARPDGTHSNGVVQAGDRCRQRLRGGRRAGTRVVVRPPGGGRGRDHGGLLPALGRPADRRRYGTAPSAHRSQPCHGHDPDRPWCRRRRGTGDGSGQPRRAERARPGRRPRNSPRNWPPSRSSACGRTGRLPFVNGECLKRTPWISSSAACRASRPNHWKARSGSRKEQAGTGRRPRTRRAGFY